MHLEAVLYSGCRRRKSEVSLSISIWQWQTWVSYMFSLTPFFPMLEGEDSTLWGCLSPYCFMVLNLWFQGQMKPLICFYFYMKPRNQFSLLENLSPLFGNFPWCLPKAFIHGGLGQPLDENTSPWCPSFVNKLLSVTKPPDYSKFPRGQAITLAFSSPWYAPIKWCLCKFLKLLEMVCFPFCLGVTCHLLSPRVPAYMCVT